MIVKADWEYVLLDVDMAGVFRVKRQAVNPNQFPLPSGSDPVMGNFWSRTASPTFSIVPPNQPQKTFKFAFWSITAQDILTGQRSAHIAGLTASDSHSNGGQWLIKAKAFFVYDFGTGPGDHGVFVDAFDVQAGDFIGDDFVDVVPDPNGSLTVSANNGFLNTTTQVGAGATVKVVARDFLPPNKQFGWWVSVSELLHSEDPLLPASISNREIVAHHNDIVVAFAFYNELEPVLTTPPVPPANYNWWWYYETRGGLVPSRVPPVPGEPWLPQFVAALDLAQAARTVAPELRGAVLELALKQISFTAATIRKQLKQSLQTKGKAGK